MKKQLWTPLALLSLMAAAPVLAADDPLFYCMTDEDKAVRILEDGDDLIYQYGADLTEPELELRRPRSEVAIRNMLKPGPIMTRQLRFVSGKYTYAVETHAVRIPSKYNHDEGEVKVYYEDTTIGGPLCNGPVRQRILFIEGVRPEEVPVVN